MVLASKKNHTPIEDGGVKNFRFVWPNVPLQGSIIVLTNLLL